MFLAFNLTGLDHVVSRLHRPYEEAWENYTLLGITSGPGEVALLLTAAYSALSIRSGQRVDCSSRTSYLLAWSGYPCEGLQPSASIVHGTFPSRCFVWELGEGTPQSRGDVDREVSPPLGKGRQSPWQLSIFA